MFLFLDIPGRTPYNKAKLKAKGRKVSRQTLTLSLSLLASLKYEADIYVQYDDKHDP